MVQLTCNNLAIGYENRTVIKDLNFSVSEGDYLFIVGENGSGKSTLMKGLLNLHPILQGEVRYGDGVKSNEIGYLPQQTVIQRDFPASVWEIVLSGCIGKCGLRPFYNRKEKKLAYEHIKRMGIEGLMQRCYRELSGGQQQRVLLARALCAADKMIFLDEPVAGLDPKVMTDLYKLIHNLHRAGMTVVMISHDIQAAMQYATHILYIGETPFFGTKQAYIESNKLKKFYPTDGGAYNGCCVQ